jgi:hypothetical protein
MVGVALAADEGRVGAGRGDADEVQGLLVDWAAAVGRGWRDITQEWVHFIIQ